MLKKEASPARTIKVTGKIRVATFHCYKTTYDLQTVTYNLPGILLYCFAVLGVVPSLKANRSLWNDWFGIDCTFFEVLMKKRLLALVSLWALTFVGCNSVGDKEALVARVNGEPIYQEDLDFFTRGSNALSNSEKMRKSVAGLFSRKAAYTKALEMFPGIKAKLDARHNDAVFEDYLLTFVYQRLYAMDRLFYSDEQLKSYYNSHRSEFPDSLTYMDVRSDVANALYASENPDSLMAYAKAHRDAKDSTKEMVIDKALKERFASVCRQQIVDTTLAYLLKKYDIQEVPLVPPTPEKYYEKHKMHYMTPPGYVVYHVESKDSAALAAKFKNKNISLENFMKLASSFSKNKETAKAKGFVGKVYIEHALPYGIGFVPDMFREFAGKDAGFVSSVVKSSVSTYHVFYLASLFGAAQKEYERVRAQVKNDVETIADFDLDSSSVVVTKNGQPAVRERDVLRVYEDNKMIQRGKRAHVRVIKSLAMQLAFASEARALGLDKTWEYRALKRQNDLDYVNKAFSDSVYNLVEVPEDSLKALYAAMGNPVYPGEDYESSRDELSDWYRIPENLLKLNYYKRLDDMLPKTFEEAKKNVFDISLAEFRQGRMERFKVESWGNAKVELLRDGFELLPQEASSDVAMKSLDSIYNQAKDLSKAYGGWIDVRKRYQNEDSVLRRSTYEIAHLASDLDDYKTAEREYLAFYRVWPSSPEAEKAMFSRGFILSENLHRNDEALKVFDEFLKTYPKSELKESVDWLVQNIKTNGKLADDLMKKISEE